MLFLHSAIERSVYSAIPAKDSQKPNKNNQVSKDVCEKGENEPETNQQLEALAGMTAVYLKA